MAATKYNYTFGKGEVVSTFVAAFYDAVLLYALALNDTLRQATNPRGQLDGAAVIKNMWNRTFQGVLNIYRSCSHIKFYINMNKVVVNQNRNSLTKSFKCKKYIYLY